MSNTNVITNIESKTKATKHFNLSDLFFLTGFLIIAYMFKGAVHELLFIPYMLFSLFNAAYLIMPSRYNKGRKNYESLAVMMKKDVLVYITVKMVKKMSNGFIKEKIKTDEKRRQKSDRNLKIFMCIFLIGYIFFYTSNYTFPKVYKTRELTIAGDSVEFDNLTLTLDIHLRIRCLR